jgi:hypothetical protein
MENITECYHLSDERRKFEHESRRQSDALKFLDSLSISSVSDRAVVIDLNVLAAVALGALVGSGSHHRFGLERLMASDGTKQSKNAADIWAAVNNSEGRHLCNSVSC